MRVDRENTEQREAMRKGVLRSMEDAEASYEELELGLRGCDGPIRRGKCRECDRRIDGCQHLKLYLRVPRFVTDRLLYKMSGNACKVLLYVASRATFDPTSNNFGRAHLHYADIARHTGVAQPGRCLRELEKLGIVKRSQKNLGPGQNYATVNAITVKWFGLLKSLGYWAIFDEVEQRMNIPRTGTGAPGAYSGRFLLDMRPTPERIVTIFYAIYAPSKRWVSLAKND